VSKASKKFKPRALSTVQITTRFQTHNNSFQGVVILEPFQISNCFFPLFKSIGKTPFVYWRIRIKRFIVLNFWKSNQLLLLLINYFALDSWC